MKSNLKIQAAIKPGLMEPYSTRRHQASITCLYSLHSLGMKSKHHTIYNEQGWCIMKIEYKINQICFVHITQSSLYYMGIYKIYKQIITLLKGQAGVKSELQENQAGAA